MYQDVWDLMIYIVGHSVSKCLGLTSRLTWSRPYVICWWPDPATTSARRRTTNVRTFLMAGCSPGEEQLRIYTGEFEQMQFQECVSDFKCVHIEFWQVFSPQ